MRPALGFEPGGAILEEELVGGGGDLLFALDRCGHGSGLLVHGCPQGLGGGSEIRRWGRGGFGFGWVAHNDFSVSGFQLFALSPQFVVGRGMMMIWVLKMQSQAA